MMQTAMNLVILSCKYFPNVADIQVAINELRADLRYQTEPKRLPGYYDTERAKATIRKVIDMIRSGNIPKAEFILDIKNMPEVYSLT